MASISTEKTSGRRTVQFMAADGKRRSIRLGKVSMRFAQTFCGHVEKLNSARIMGGAVERDTAAWVATLDSVMLDKLASVGLIEPQTEAEPIESSESGQSEITLSSFLASYVNKRTDVKQSTQISYGHTRRNLIAFFGDDKLLTEITPGDADDFQRYLKERNLAVATANRRCNMAKSFLRSAVRHKVITENPFQDISAGVKSNPARQRFISRETIERVIEFAPDAEWRLLIALARYGGLRVPSEALSLTWIDIDWANKRIRIPSPKTEHHDGKESREIPLFPELAERLQDVFDQAENGTEFVISRHRPLAVRENSGWTNANLRTRFYKIIRRAGLTPWPRLWQNLRSSRETELAEDFPLHVEVAWLGNSEAVATRHYLQVTDDHFAIAAQEAVQNPVQSASESHRQTSQADSWTTTKKPEMQRKTATCENMRPLGVGDER